MSRLDYLETYSSKKTVESYKYALKNFFGTIYGEGTLEANAERYFNEKRDYEKDIQTFLAKIKKRPPKTSPRLAVTTAPKRAARVLLIFSVNINAYVHTNTAVNTPTIKRGYCIVFALDIPFTIDRSMRCTV